MFASEALLVPARRAQIQLLLDAADGAGKPVLIGEATPQYAGADDAGDWDAWFEPYFELIEQSPGIKGYTYINWDWTTTDPRDHWTNWGDARLETADPTVAANYLKKIGRHLFVNAETEVPGFLANLK